MSNKHVISDLYQMQSLPLNAKISMTQRRIREWVDEYGEDGVYISFSGGKDSTVLLDIARKLYPNIKAMFIDTGLEYPEIRAFVKTFENVDWIKPKLTFRKVIEKYGYPFIGKEISNCIYGARKGSKTRLKRLQGAVTTGGGSKKSKFNCEKWRFMLEAPFEVNDTCCAVMKKRPAKKYYKETGKRPILAMLASESQKRTIGWLKTGCNAFELKYPQSQPMAFWTEQDILLYIRQLQDEYDQNLAACNMEVRCRADKTKRRKARKYIKKQPKRFEICSVYGKVVTEDEAHGQMTLADVSNMEIFDLGRPVLKTTGCERTGCMFCGYGCHLEKSPGRFEKMKLTHPKQYEYIMKPWDEGGLGFKEIIDWINEHGNLNIRY